MTRGQRGCLSIAGFDPSGGAGIVADVKTFAAFGCAPTAAAITSITFQNSSGVFGAIHQTAGSIRGQLEPIFAEYEIAAVKIGMLPTADIVREVARILREKEARNIVTDPVISSTSGYKLIEDDSLSIIIEEVFPISTLVTPNIPETERITGFEIRTRDNIAEAAKQMSLLGARNVLIKGGHFEEDGGMSSDFLFIDGELTILEAELLRDKQVRGTGCMLSSAIAANLALGRELTDAVGISKGFVFEAIRSQGS